MSEASYDPSVTSPAASRAASPTVVDSTAPPTIILEPLIHTPPISPRNATTILHNHPNNLIAAREVAEGLVATCERRSAQGQRQINALQEQNRNLRELVARPMGQI